MNYTQKNAMIEKICGVLLMLIAFEVFFGVVQSSFECNYAYSDVTFGIRIAGGVFLAIGVILLISGYLKKKGTRAVYGVELLALAFSAAVLPGSYLYYSAPFNSLHKVLPIAFLVYYIGKTAYIVYDSNKVAKKSTKKKKR